MTDVAVTLRDIEEAREMFGACLNYFTALDIAERHRHLTTQGSSAITQELERLKERYDGYLGDYLREKYEAELEEQEEEETEPEDDDEEPSGTPFGAFEVPGQKGRVVTRQELLERDVGKLEEGEVVINDGMGL